MRPKTDEQKRRWRVQDPDELVEKAIQDGLTTD